MELYPHEPFNFVSHSSVASQDEDTVLYLDVECLARNTLQCTKECLCKWYIDLMVI